MQARKKHKSRKKIPAPKKFTVFIEWNYCGVQEETYERCIITPATDKDLENDGFNFVGKSGNEGAELFVCNSLEKAILNAGFNPFKIQYCRLTDKEIKEKDALLSQYTWMPETGLQKKSKSN